MRTLKQEASSKKQTGHALAGNNDPCTCTVESQLSHPTVGIPIGSVISCSRTFYLQKTQQKTSSSCQSTLASPGLALLWNLVVIINYRDCPRVHLAPAILHFPSSPALPRAKQSTQHLDGPNNLEAAPSTEGREEGTYRKADLRAARQTTACQELRASIFFFLLGLVCLCCFVGQTYRKANLQSEQAKLLRIASPCSNLGLPGMDTNSTSFASPLASPQNGNINIPLQLEYVVDAISHASVWTVLWTIVALAVAYDQSMFCPELMTAKQK